MKKSLILGMCVLSSCVMFNGVFAMNLDSQDNVKTLSKCVEACKQFIAGKLKANQTDNISALIGMNVIHQRLLDQKNLENLKSSIQGSQLNDLSASCAQYIAERKTACETVFDANQQLIKNLLQKRIDKKVSEFSGKLDTVITDLLQKQKQIVDYTLTNNKISKENEWLLNEIKSAQREINEMRIDMAALDSMLQNAENAESYGSSQKSFSNYHSELLNDNQNSVHSNHIRNEEEEEEDEEGE